MATIQPHLGILVGYSMHRNPPFGEKGFFKILTVYGKKLGIDVTVFSPGAVVWDKQKVLGYRYDLQQNTWVQGLFPIPNLLYDRIFYSTKEQLQRFHLPIQRLLEDQNAILLGRGLPGKWKVYQMCKENEILKEFFPETIAYQLNNQSEWRKKLLKYGSLFFKPATGSHGRGVFKLKQTSDGFHIQGRTQANQLFTKEFRTIHACQLWIKGFVAQRTYIIQPYLELMSKEQTPFDIRILIQKNEQGKWAETGRAIRVGQKSSITSNLHGGGTAVDADLFLKKNFSTTTLEQIEEQIKKILIQLPIQLEKKHGPLIELGIDLGIDLNGRVWILEANSKPGRKSFQITHNRKAHLNALLAPVRYTHYLVSHNEGSKKKND